eukprot:TRINITY_DN18822_c0_g1_i1.p1 TRINITY_DN18822_c0_g1~~TRINITY_DN18822_c0_g1_i1.p1  ORF type:complete len:416 (+),score=143.12 TRINITY_DN18822_c0_g1_i1:49-1296(+)
MRRALLLSLVARGVAAQTSCAASAIAQAAAGRTACATLATAVSTPGAVAAADLAAVCSTCIPELMAAQALASCPEANNSVAALRDSQSCAAVLTPAPSPAPTQECGTVAGLTKTLADVAALSAVCSDVAVTLSGAALTLSQRAAVCGDCLKLPEGVGAEAVATRIAACAVLRDATAAACAGYGPSPAPTPAPAPVADASGSGSASSSDTSTVSIGGPIFNVFVGIVSGVVCIAWFLIWFNYVRKSKVNKQQEERLKNFNMLDVHPTRLGRKRESHKPGGLVQDVAEEGVEGGLSNLFIAPSGDGTSFAASRGDGASRYDRGELDMTLAGGAGDDARSDVSASPDSPRTSGWKKVQRVRPRARAVVAFRAAGARRQDETPVADAELADPPRISHRASGRLKLEEPLLRTARTERLV